MAFVSIGCNVCGEPVSQGFEAPEGFEIGGWIECPACIMIKGPSIQHVATLLSQRLMRPEFYGSSDLHRTKMIDATARDIVQSLDNLRFRQGA